MVFYTDLCVSGFDFFNYCIVKMNKIVFALYKFGGNVHIVIKLKSKNVYIHAKYHFYLFSFGIFHEIHPLYKY